METLSNEILTIQVSSHGAELCSLRSGGREYLWQADPAIWARHSPVLFPIVGRVWNDVYRVGGTEYRLSQHGFARDSEFQLIRQTADEVRYRLADTPQSRERYPFAFELEIGYRLEGRAVRVLWQVRNPSATERLTFQIGAHPGFYFPTYDPAEEGRGYFRLDAAGSVTRVHLAEKGCADPTHQEEVPLEEGGWLPLTRQLFAQDALVLEQGQVHRVTLCDADRHPAVTLTFDAPLVGLWSPPGKNAPFVCIEPWYGRCDRAGYDGDFADRDWMQQLAPGQTFQASYLIEVEG